MSKQEVLKQALFFHKEMGCNPKKYTYSIKVTPAGYAIYAHDKRSQAEYVVAFYNHSSGRLVGAQ